MENKSHALAAGTFVLLLTAMLISTAVWLTRDTRAMRIFELAGKVSLSGLQPQAGVRFHGVPVGKVTAMGLDPQDKNQVLVTIAVDDQAPISAATFATLGYMGVTGLAYVQLDDHGEPTPAPLTGRIPLKPALMTTLTEQGERLLGQLEQSTKAFNQLLSPVNQQAVTTALENIGKAASDVQQLSAQARQTLPELAQAGRETVATLKATSVRVGDSADEARASARAFRQVTERMSAPGGTLDQLDRSADILVATGQTLRVNTLPQVNQAVAEAARTTHRLGDLTQTLNDNPQAILLGKPVLPPGPGEPGFSAPAAARQ